MLRQEHNSKQDSEVPESVPDGRRPWLAGGAIVALFLCIAIYALSSPDGNRDLQPTRTPEQAGIVRQSTSTPRPPASASTAVASMSALEQMELAFSGNPRQSVIKPKIDRAMRLYGLQLTEDNYSRAGSVLVTMRQQNSVDELDILDYMICAHASGVNMTFPEMAALSAVALRTGDRCR